GPGLIYPKVAKHMLFTCRKKIFLQQLPGSEIVFEDTRSPFVCFSESAHLRDRRSCGPKNAACRVDLHPEHCEEAVARIRAFNLSSLCVDTDDLASMDAPDIERLRPRVERHTFSDQRLAGKL